MRSDPPSPTSVTSRALNTMAGMLVFAILAGNPVSADIITVCDSGCDYSSINAAIDHANNGDVIEISAGLHQEMAIIDTDGLAITIRGVADTDGDGLPETILDGGMNNTVISCMNGETSGTVFEHLVVQNGQGMNGGGMRVDGNSSPTMANCVFRWNSADKGGGLYVGTECNVELVNCLFIENTAQNSGGGMFANRSIHTLSNCTFERNTATYGGGLHDNNLLNSPTYEYCNFNGNIAIYGGGLYCYRSNAILTECTFTGNNASRDAGGLLCSRSDATLTECTFTSNSSDWGGAMCNGDCNPTLTDCTITSNHANTAGGGIFNICSAPVISGSIICGNTIGTTGQEVATDENQVQDDGCNEYVDAGDNCIVGDCNDCYPEDEGCGSDLSVPALNPAMNPDGTMTYWVGNNMQWDIQEAIDDCSPGDIIVIRCGDYVDSLSINKPNITVRPFVNSAGRWEQVNLWNPTQGPQAENDWAVLLGPNTSNTYVGRPRAFRQLASGYVSPNTIRPGEYAADPSVTPLEVGNIPGPCFTIWSRSIDKTGIMGDNARATVENCVFTSENGFGGGVMITGDDTSLAFVDCTFENLYANGSTLRGGDTASGLENHCISIFAGSGTAEYTFSGCTITNNRGEAIVYQDGGAGTWRNCTFTDNNAEVNYSGVVTLLGGCNPRFLDCSFRRNSSGYGTIYFNGEGTSSVDGIRFANCTFRNNQTIDNRWGGVIYAIDSSEYIGTPPKMLFDNCDMDGNNNNVQIDQDDWISPWFPTYRQGRSNEQALGSEEAPCVPNSDINGDGIVDGADLGIIFANWGTNGAL